MHPRTRGAGRENMWVLIAEVYEEHDSDMCDKGGEVIVIGRIPSINKDLK